MKKKRIAPTRWFDISSSGVYNPHNIDFRCVHCRHHVSADALLAGVYNRNHCPYCLWSRHMDWRKPGDRMAACKAQMQPIGLTVKRARKKYASEKSGELMLIHLCMDCGKLSINRLAADDDSDKVMNLFTNSQQLDAETRTQLKRSRIQVLERGDQPIVQRQLCGQS